MAEKMVKEQKSIVQAARDLGIELTIDDLEAQLRSDEFQRVLWKTKFEYYSGIANQPGRTKAAALGLMTLALENLALKGEWEKVIEGVLKLGKVEGWVGGDSNVNVFANLTAKDIEDAIKRLQELVQPTGTSKDSEPVQPN